LFVLFITVFSHVVVTSLTEQTPDKSNFVIKFVFKFAALNCGQGGLHRRFVFSPLVNGSFFTPKAALADIHYATNIKN
jgi:hypothetical protein